LASVLEKQPYLMGNDFCIADAYLFTVLNWGKWVKIDLAPWPALLAYQARIAARPGVQQALKKEGLL
jgi:glutathione S-transferase